LIRDKPTALYTAVGSMDPDDVAVVPAAFAIRDGNAWDDDVGTMHKTARHAH
jgi:hypothetical protein